MLFHCRPLLLQSFMRHFGGGFFCVLLALLLGGCATSGSSNYPPDSLEACIQTDAPSGAGDSPRTRAFAVTAAGQASSQAAVARDAAWFIPAWRRCAPKFAKVSATTARPQQEAANIAGYQPRWGVQVQFALAQIDPSYVRPGDAATVNGYLYVFAPDANQAVPVRLTRRATLRSADGQALGELDLGEDALRLTPGVQEVRMNLPVPANSPLREALLDVSLEVKGEGMTDELKGRIQITENTELLAKAPHKAAGLLVLGKLRPPPEAPSVAVPDSAAADGNTAKIQVIATIRVRAKPDLKSPIVETVAKGTKLELLLRTTVGGVKWVQVKLSPGKTGWLHERATRPE